MQCPNCSAEARSVPDSEESTFLLRSDLHRVFDNRGFALVPKRDDQGQRHLVVHFFSIVKSLGDTALYIHNRTTHSLESVVIEFLFARFALTVFACIKEFIIQGMQRTSRLRSVPIMPMDIRPGFHAWCK